MALPAKGKTALITGAGSGICFSFAFLLISKGCNVVIADLALRPEAQKLVDTAGQTARAIFVKTDVTVWSDLEQAIATGVKEFGGIDIWCPGAGIFDPQWSNFWFVPGSPTSVDTPTSNGYKSLDINLTHPTRLTQLAIAHLLTRKARGSIVCISSIAAQHPNLIVPLYAIAKAGVSALIRSFAPLEPKFGIRVTGIAPGLVKTPLFTENPDKLSMIDTEKDVWVEPEECAEAMLGLVEGEDVQSGTVLEIASKRTRKVEVLNDPGSSGDGIFASNAGKHLEDVIEALGKEGWGITEK